MKRFGIITTALPARGSKRASLRSYVPSKTWRLFHQASRRYQLQALFFRADDVDFARGKVHAWSCSSYDGLSGWKRGYHPLPDVVYENCFLNLVVSDPRILAVKHQFVRRGIPTFNPGLFNKSGLHHVLSQSQTTRNLLPPSRPVDTMDDVLSFFRAYPCVYLKPVNGSGGAGILQLSQLSDGRIQVKAERFYKDQPFNQILDRTEFRQFLSRQVMRRKYIVQKGLKLLHKGKQKVDFRVVIHRGNDGKWRSIGIRPKLGKEGSIVTNSHAGGKKTTWEKLLMWAKQYRVNLPPAEKLADAALAVGEQLSRLRPTLSHLGIDVAVDEQQRIYVLDINPRPGRDLLTSEMLLQVTDCTAGFASYLAQKGSKKSRMQVKEIKS